MVILGNSIVFHAPTDSLGWYGAWGMAATNIDSDFVHLLINDIHKKNSLVSVRFKSIVDFEWAYSTFQFNQLDSFKNADILIMKICENVNQQAAKDSGFINYYNSLIKYLNPGGNAVIVSCDGFWDLPVNALVQNNAIKQNYIFVQLNDLSLDSTNMALGMYKNNDVARHPSNKGMREIKKRIWNKIGSYF